MEVKMESMGKIPINCDVKTFNEIWCGGLNDACDSHCDPEVKSERKPAMCTQCEYFKHYEKELDEEARFFGTHIREVIRTFKEAFKKK